MLEANDWQVFEHVVVETSAMKTISKKTNNL